MFEKIIIVTIVTIVLLVAARSFWRTWTGSGKGGVLRLPGVRKHRDR